MKSININIEGITDLGKVRKNNEDYFNYFQNQNNIVAFVGISDGMGGLDLGEVASKESIEAVIKEIKKNKFVNDDRTEYFELLKSINNKVHKDIYDISLKKESQMGCTLTYGFIKNNKFYFCHIGDSRIYTLNKKKSIFGSSFNINQLTTDHNPEGSPSILTKYIGSSENFDPQIDFISLNEIDYLLFTTDGLHDLIRSNDIKDIFNDNDDQVQINKKLVKKANENGGRDNISLVSVKINA